MSKRVPEPWFKSHAAAVRWSWRYTDPVEFWKAVALVTGGYGPPIAYTELDEQGWN